MAQAQTIERFNTFSYSVNDGLLQSTMGDIVIDKNNFCWISFPKGIQKFDGKNFTSVTVQPGLPDDQQVKFFKCSNGDLLLSHSQGISKYETTANKLVQVYKNPSPVTKAVSFIGEDDSIIYFYSGDGTISGIHCNSFKILSVIKPPWAANHTGIGYPIKFSDNIINHVAGFIINYRMYRWNLKAGKLLDSSAIIPDMSLYLLHLKSENEIFYYTSQLNNTIQLYDFTKKKSSVAPLQVKDDRIISRCNIYPWQKKVLISFNNRLFETDSTLQILKSELVNFQNEPVSGRQSIADIMEDNFGNLYIQTVTGGIRKILCNNYPVKYYGTIKKEDNFILSLLPDKKQNRVLAGTTGNGLLVFDTLQHLIKHIKTLPGKSLPYVINSIIKTNKGDYLLFIMGQKNVWMLSNNFSVLKPLPISTSLPSSKTGIPYFGNTLFQNDREAVVQSQNRIYKTDFITNTVTEHEFSNNYIMGGLLYGNKIISHGGDELILLDAATCNEIKRIPFKNTGNVRCFVSDAAGVIYMGSNNGIFKIDENGKILQHLTKENGLPDDCIYAMLFDKAGLLWCSTNKGIFRLNKDNSILQLTKDDGLQENEFNTNVAAISQDGEFFFGGVNGISSFYPSAISPYEEKVKLLFTNIKVNNADIFKDSAAWAIDNISLAHDKNAVAFNFTAMGSSNPEQYIYQYKMEGVDKQWIQNTELQTVRYLLPPGKYSFQVYASRSFNKDAKPMKEIKIIINPPFWKTWWFFTLLGLLFIAGTAFSINFYNKRKYKKKLEDLESEHKIQLERERISRDLHDSIGAYANAVLYNTELLQKEEGSSNRSELINDLKFASKDIITSLRETIWALKKDEYTAQDCLLRIRNFVQPFSRYYPHINFRVDGEAPEKMSLHYTKALNLVRIVQEALSNAIKHADAKSISIISSIENDKWRIAVADDGSGFDYASVYELQQGNGLNNIKQRAEDSGFELINESILQKGTVITILLHQKDYPTGV